MVYKLLILVLGLTTAATARADNLYCHFEFVETYSHSTGANRVFKILEKRPVPPTTNFNALNGFHAWVRSQVSPDPVALLQRQRAIYAAHFPAYVPLYDRILSREVGNIVGIDCLEYQLLSLHYRVQGNFQTPTEFMAKVFEKGFEAHVIFVSNGDASVSMDADEEARIEEYVRNGWSYRVNLHNHPFIFDNPSGDIAGTLIPSGTSTSGDIGTYLREYANYGLEQAWITNGFHTIRFRQDEFERLD